MKLILDYFYPICGYQEGWCNKRSKNKCRYNMNLWEVSDRFCKYFMQKHPKTEENYREFVRNRGGKFDKWQK